MPGPQDHAGFGALGPGAPLVGAVPHRDRPDQSGPPETGGGHSPQRLGEDWILSKAMAQGV